MPDPNLRAADTDRQAAAAALGRHLSDGRLTVEEYDERLTRAYAARTYGDLDQLFSDLPRATPAPRPQPASPSGAGPAPRGATGCGSGHVPARGSWAGWMTVAVIVSAIWLFTSIAGGFHYFWPIWVVGPWGAVLLTRTLGGGRQRPRDRRRR